MKTVFSIVLLCLFSYAYGQKRPFNCGLLVEIVKSMDKERQKIETFYKIKGKFDYIDEGDGKYKVKAKEAYRNDAVLDSILKLPDILEIADPHIDSIFYLQGDNVFLDTFKFFTPECNCKVNGKKIRVVNDMSKLLPSETVKVISVNALNNYRNYSCVFLKYKGSHPKIDRVIFFYLIERNKHVIKNIELSRRDMIDYDFPDD